ncbi:cytochrome P450 [Mycobacterium tuberculosis GuangZ0019]|nr:cytochrome P450 [Mycobacterium tuberculosis GuangZ0019]
MDLADGNFYASREARAAYRWMRANQPVFRDRNGLAAASTYQAVIDAERQPELFSNAGGIRPDQPALPMMIDMDDPAHLLRRKLVNAGFTRKRVKDKEASIAALCDTLIDAVCERGECDFVRDLAAPLPMAVIRRHARGASRAAGHVLAVVRRSGDIPQFACVSRGFPDHHGRLRGLQRLHPGHHCGTASGPHRRPGQRAGEFRS